MRRAATPTVQRLIRSSGGSSLCASRRARCPRAAAVLAEATVVGRCAQPPAHGTSSLSGSCCTRPVRTASTSPRTMTTLWCAPLRLRCHSATAVRWRILCRHRACRRASCTSLTRTTHPTHCCSRSSTESTMQASHARTVACVGMPTHLRRALFRFQSRRARVRARHRGGRRAGSRRVRCASCSRFFSSVSFDNHAVSASTPDASWRRSGAPAARGSG